MNKEKLNEIRARLEAATPGPWEWDVNSRFHDARLMTTHSGRYCVMCFRRWGTQGAMPVFQIYEKYEGRLIDRNSHGMAHIDKLLKSIPDKQHHKGFDDYIDHPDADLISNAPSDIKALLEYIEELEERIRRLRNE